MLSSIIHYGYSQFGEPPGVLGRLAGYIMANRPSNIERNDWALSLLEIKPADRILEIGSGLESRVNVVQFIARNFGSLPNKAVTTIKMKSDFS